MIIRRSTASDIPTLLRLADEARQIMRRSGNMNQWVNGYPDRAAFESDIQQQGSYIVENDLGEPVGCFAMLPGPEPTYARIYEGQWLDTERPYYVIHRIASLPQAHGVLRAIIDHAFTVTDNICIDTHRDNTIMRHLLERLGFTYCGIIYLTDGAERLAYQRIT